VNGLKLSLTLSVTGHAACLALLLLFPSDKSTLPPPVAEGGIEVVFQPALPRSEAAPLPEPVLQPETPPPPAETTPPEPQAEVAPPTPEPAVTATEPAPPAPNTEASVAATAPPPPPKPLAKKPPKPVQRQQEPPQPSQAYLPSALPQPSSAQAAPPQTTSAATPVPSPLGSQAYGALASAWLERHKRYPDAARQRGEEGSAVLRFEVDRDGRVINYAVTKSSGYLDLDESIEEMMRGATLPPFPAGMTEPHIQVSVTIRFSLRR
jgi:periplasmic protein TonB